MKADNHTADSPDGTLRDELSKADLEAVPTPATFDDEYRLYQRDDGQNLDPVEAKKVLRKIDYRIVPMLILIYLIQYLDKNGINYASAYGLQKGTKLHGQDFSWLGSIFYFGESWIT